MVSGMNLVLFNDLFWKYNWLLDYCSIFLSVSDAVIFGGSTLAAFVSRLGLLFYSHIHIAELIANW